MALVQFQDMTSLSRPHMFEYVLNELDDPGGKWHINRFLLYKVNFKTS